MLAIANKKSNQLLNKIDVPPVFAFLPTSYGKSILADYAMLAFDGIRVFCNPLKALCSEVYERLKKFQDKFTFELMIKLDVALVLKLFLILMKKVMTLLLLAVLILILAIIVYFNFY
jgi:hypothetical protein